MTTSRFSLVLGIAAAFTASIAHKVAAEERSELLLSIGFANDESYGRYLELQKLAEDGKVPFLLAYIQGEFAGIVPGTFRLPSTREPIAIEIGVPQLRKIPIYSLVLATSNLHAPVDVVTSSFEFDYKDSPEVWNGAYIEPNKIETTKLEELKEGYELELPADSYASFVEFWYAKGISRSGPNSIASIPDKNDESLSGKYEHSLYDRYYVASATSFPAGLQAF